MAKLSVVRMYEAGQLKGREWLSVSYRIEPFTTADEEAADFLYTEACSHPNGDAYYSDYLGNVKSLSGDTYCDVKYLIKDADGAILGYLGLATRRGVIKDFAHIPLVDSYDPRITLLIKQWLFDHASYGKVYYMMRYGWSKNSPIDHYLGVIHLGDVSPEDSTRGTQLVFYYKTRLGGGKLNESTTIDNLDPNIGSGLETGELI